MDSQVLLHICVCVCVGVGAGEIKRQTERVRDGERGKGEAVRYTINPY